MAPTNSPLLRAQNATGTPKGGPQQSGNNSFSRLRSPAPTEIIREAKHYINSPRDKWKAKSDRQRFSLDADILNLGPPACYADPNSPFSSPSSRSLTSSLSPSNCSEKSFDDSRIRRPGSRTQIPALVRTNSLNSPRAGLRRRDLIKYPVLPAKDKQDSPEMPQQGCQLSPEYSFTKSQMKSNASPARPKLQHSQSLDSSRMSELREQTRKNISPHTHLLRDHVDNQELSVSESGEEFGINFDLWRENVTSKHFWGPDETCLRQKSIIRQALRGAWNSTSKKPYKASNVHDRPFHSFSEVESPKGDKECEEPATQSRRRVQSDADLIIDDEATEQHSRTAENQSIQGQRTAEESHVDICLASLTLSGSFDETLSRSRSERGLGEGNRESIDDRQTKRSPEPSVSWNRVEWPPEVCHSDRAESGNSPYSGQENSLQALQNTQLDKDRLDSPRSKPVSDARRKRARDRLKNLGRPRCLSRASSCSASMIKSGLSEESSIPSGRHSERQGELESNSCILRQRPKSGHSIGVVDRYNSKITSENSSSSSTSYSEISSELSSHSSKHPNSLDDRAADHKVRDDVGAAQNRVIAEPSAVAAWTATTKNISSPHSDTKTRRLTERNLARSNWAANHVQSSDYAGFNRTETNAVQDRNLSESGHLGQPPHMSKIGSETDICSTRRNESGTNSEVSGNYKGRSPKIAASPFIFEFPLWKAASRVPQPDNNDSLTPRAHRGLGAHKFRDSASRDEVRAQTEATKDATLPRKKVSSPEEEVGEVTLHPHYRSSDQGELKQSHVAEQNTHAKMSEVSLPQPAASKSPKPPLLMKKSSFSMKWKKSGSVAEDVKSQTTQSDLAKTRSTSSKDRVGHIRANKADKEKLSGERELGAQTELQASWEQQHVLTGALGAPGLCPSSPLLWRKGEEIGRGTFGKVFKGLDARTGKIFAVKQVELPSGRGRHGGDEMQKITRLQQEILLMKELDHEHIVRYLGTDMDGDNLYIFIEYIPGGSLASMLSQFGVFEEDLTKHFIRQILLGVEYLHSRGIAHRDIKGANVLVNEDGVAKLADFGCSKQLEGVMTHSLEKSLCSIRGSVPWMAPEVIRQTGHGRKADIWSLGATMVEMVTATHPWPSFTNNVAALFTIATSNKPPPYPETLSEAAKDFLEQCFQMDPEKRATASQLLSHPFLQDSQ